MPAQDKIVSLFEPHTAIIRRQKVRKPTEFGHKVWLDEVDGGIVTKYRRCQRAYRRARRTTLQNYLEGRA